MTRTCAQERRRVLKEMGLTLGGAEIQAKDRDAWCDALTAICQNSKYAGGRS